MASQEKRVTVLKYGKTVKCSKGWNEMQTLEGTDQCILTGWNRGQYDFVTKINEGCTTFKSL